CAGDGRPGRNQRKRADEEKNRTAEIHRGGEHCSAITTERSADLEEGKSWRSVQIDGCRSGVRERFPGNTGRKHRDRTRYACGPRQSQEQCGKPERRFYCRAASQQQDVRAQWLISAKRQLRQRRGSKRQVFEKAECCLYRWRRRGGWID